MGIAHQKEGRFVEWWAVPTLRGALNHESLDEFDDVAGWALPTKKGLVCIMVGHAHPTVVWLPHVWVGVAL